MIWATCPTFNVSTSPSKSNFSATCLTRPFQPLFNFNFSISRLHCAFNNGASIGSAVNTGCAKYSFGNIQQLRFWLNKQVTASWWLISAKPIGSGICNSTFPKWESPVSFLAIWTKPTNKKMLAFELNWNASTGWWIDQYASLFSCFNSGLKTLQREPMKCSRIFSASPKFEETIAAIPTEP